MKLLLTLFVLTLSFQTITAKTCTIERDFDPKTLKRLAKAMGYKSGDWVAKALGSQEYTVNIVHSEKRNRYLVLLGEYHMKRMKAHKLGKKVLSRFKYRMLEGVPRPEYSKIDSIIDGLTKNKGLKNLNKKLLNSKNLMRLSTFRFFDSTIRTAQEDDLTFRPDTKFAVSYDDKIVREYAETSVTQPSDVIRILGEVPEWAKSGHINLPLEVGALAIFAAASAPLHWNCPRSGRSDRTTTPSSAGNPASANAEETISVRVSVSDGMGSLSCFRIARLF